MTIATSSRPAADRARVAGTAAALAALVSIAGVVMMGTGSAAGFPVTVAGLSVLYWQTHRYFVLRALDEAGPLPLGEIADQLPLLGGVSKADLQIALAGRERSRHYLLRDGDAWRVVARRTLIDVLLSGVERSPDPHIFGHPARWIDAAGTLDHLRRMPADGEVWLLRAAGDVGPPLAITRSAIDAAIAAARDRDAVGPTSVSPRSSGRATVPPRRPSRADSARRALPRPTPAPATIDLSDEREGASSSRGKALPA